MNLLISSKVEGRHFITAYIHVYLLNIMEHVSEILDGVRYGKNLQCNKVTTGKTRRIRKHHNFV